MPADSSKRMIAGLEGGFKFVINLLKEIRELTKVKESGFPHSMLVNSLEYLYQSIKQTETGALYNVDQLSFMLDSNLTEARSFLLSVVKDPESPPRAIELSAKLIF